MTAVLNGPLRRLSRALFDLRDRVREALAGEVARAVGEAVREVVAVVLRGGPPSVAPPPGNDDRPGRSHWTDPDADGLGDRPAAAEPPAAGAQPGGHRAQPGGRPGH